MLETDLYPAVKRLLERQGYEVKGEIRECDVVGVKPGADPVVVELKTAFGLPLILQGVARKSVSEAVYIAFPEPQAAAGKGAGAQQATTSGAKARATGGGKGGLWRARRREILKLCRMLGLGVITVGRDARPELDPAPYKPRPQARKRALLLREFERRAGDPTPGGATRRPVMTAYRQDALRCAAYLRDAGQARPAEIKAAAGVEQAGRILLRDVYGWFERVERGVYRLSPTGGEALKKFGEAPPLAAAQPSEGEDADGAS